MQSRKPVAKQFKREVKEVLRSIRKHGAYMTLNKIDELLSDPDTIIQLAQTLKAERTKRQIAEQQAEGLAAQLDESMEWYTIKRVAAINGISWRDLDWRKLKHQSIVMDRQTKKIFDANFGQVNLYHSDVFKSVYPELVFPTGRETGVTL
jgi:pyruvate-formate lyase